MPFKNESRYVQQCVDSILNQDYLNWELIAVDDHSRDDSTDKLKAYAVSDARVRYILNEGVGVIAALSTALKHSRGTCVTRMDADDYKSADNLSLLQAVLEPGKISIGLVKYFREDGLGEGYTAYESWINRVNSSGNTWNEVYRECVIPSPCWLVYKEDLIKAGGFDSELYPEDYDLCFRFYRAGLIPVCVPKVIHFWRDHDIRTTRVSPHYSDNLFTHLKVHYFLEIDFNPSMQMVLIGAGKKAKKVAKLLIDAGIHFEWYTNNENKSGRDIYGIILRDFDSFLLKSTQQVFVVISNSSELTTLTGQTIEGPNVYPLC